MSYSSNSCLLSNSVLNAVLLQVYKKSEKDPVEHGGVVCITQKKVDNKYQLTDVKVAGPFRGKKDELRLNPTKICKGINKDSFPIGMVHTHRPSLVLGEKKVLYSLGEATLSRADLKIARDVGFDCVLTRMQNDVFMACAEFPHGKKETCATIVKKDVSISPEIVKQVRKRLEESGQAWTSK